MRARRSVYKAQAMVSRTPTHSPSFGLGVQLLRQCFMLTPYTSSASTHPTLTAPPPTLTASPPTLRHPLPPVLHHDKPRRRKQVSYGNGSVNLLCSGAHLLSQQSVPAISFHSSLSQRGLDNGGLYGSLGSPGLLLSCLDPRPGISIPREIDQLESLLAYSKPAIQRDVDISSSEETTISSDNLRSGSRRNTSAGPPPPPPNKATPSQLSFILLKLREELPAFFEGHHSYDMYSSVMKFENNLSQFAWTSRGCHSYRLFLNSFRCWVRLGNSHPQLELIKITKDVDSGKIEARWRVSGYPRQRLRWRSEKRVIIEGFSTFVVNSDGLIELHRMDRVMPAPKERSLARSWMASLGILLGLSPKPALPPQPTVTIQSTVS